MEYFMTVQSIRRKLKRLGNKQKAEILKRFFKTGPGEYGAGDVFYGIQVPVLRKIASEYRESASLSSISSLMQSSVHEERFLALLLLIQKFQCGNEHEQRKMYKLYFRNMHFVNNWDLVDLSAPQIIGAFLENRRRSPLYTLVESMNLWDRRIAILATLHFIRKNDCRDTLKIATLLLSDEEDLIHKAVGWMLREVGKQNPAALEKLLRRYARRMPRTMLRYAIERMSAGDRARHMRRGLPGRGRRRLC